MEALSNETAIRVVKDMTVEEIAAALGKSIQTVRNWIKKFELEPSVPTQRHHGGTTAALYDMNAFAKLKEEEEELVLQEKQAAAGKKAAEGMALIGRQAFVRTVVDEMTFEEHVQFTLHDVMHLLQSAADERVAMQQALDKEQRRVAGWKAQTEGFARSYVSRERLASESAKEALIDCMDTAEQHVEACI